MEPFKRDVLFGPRSPKPISNKCGDQDGLSVVRRNTLNDDDVRVRSSKLVEGRSDTQPEGAYLASVADLRALRHASVADQQIVFVYDDPTASEMLHAVVRASDQIPRAYQDPIRQLIKQAFAKRLQQSA